MMEAENEVHLLTKLAVQDALSALVQAIQNKTDIRQHLSRINAELPEGYEFEPCEHECFWIRKNGMLLRHNPKGGQKKGLPMLFRGGIEAWEGAVRYVWAHDLLGLAPDEEVPK